MSVCDIGYVALGRRRWANGGSATTCSRTSPPPCRAIRPVRCCRPSRNTTGAGGIISGVRSTGRGRPWSSAPSACAGTPGTSWDCICRNSSWPRIFLATVSSPSRTPRSRSSTGTCSTGSHSMSRCTSARTTLPAWFGASGPPECVSPDMGSNNITDQLD